MTSLRSVDEIRVIMHWLPHGMRSLGLGLVLLSLDLAGCARGMTVTVSNDTGDTITDVHLRCRTEGNEASSRVGAIQPHQSSAPTRLVFDAESYLLLSFRDSGGTAWDKQIDIYLERSHTPVTLHVLPGPLVHCEGECGKLAVPGWPADRSKGG